MRSFLKNSSLQLKVGLILLILLFILSFIMPLFSHVDPGKWNTYIMNLKPSSEHLFGTNDLGQDIFWLLASSIQSSIVIGLIVAAVSTIIGVFMGMLAGFTGGFIDRIISLIMDTFITIPSFPILLLVASLFMGRATVFDISLIIIIFCWPWSARQVRSMVLSLRERDFIETARFSGESLIKILFKEILPFIVSFAAASFINTILAAIRTESSLAVIGMSNSAWTTLGTMIYWALSYRAILMGKWLWLMAPVVATVLVFAALFMTLSGVQKYNALRRGQEV